MNNEVKEILDKLNNLINFDENLIGWQINGNGETISKKDFKLLLDYITNLQQENETLKEKVDKQYNVIVEKDNLLSNRYGVIEHLSLANEDYKSRTDKAIELIEKEKYIAYDYYDNEYITLDEEDILKLLNILQGSDKE